MSPTAFELFAVSAVTMGLSRAIARERLFAPLRATLNGDKTWLGYLVSCPYCFSHYVAFVLVPLTGAYAIRIRPAWGLVSAILDWFLSSIFVTVIAAFLRIGARRQLLPAINDNYIPPPQRLGSLGVSALGEQRRAGEASN